MTTRNKKSRIKRCHKNAIKENNINKMNEIIITSNDKQMKEISEKKRY